MQKFFITYLIYIFFVQPSLYSKEQVKSQNEKILICGVCKNIADHAPNLIWNAESLGKLFKDYQIIIYENNSIDGTPELLLGWAKANPRVFVMSENLSYEELKMNTKGYEHDFKPFRSELIANARNKVLEVISESQFSEYQFVVMVDLDFSSAWPISEIIQTIESDIEWDCVSANGITADGFYRDWYALRTPQSPFGPELLGDRWWRELPKMSYNEGAWIPVYSAFGGLAIYQREQLLLARYAGSATEELSADYENILNTLPKKQRAIQRYLGLNKLTRFNESRIPLIYAQKENYFNSGGFGAPVVCEHVVLHAQMRQNGSDKIFINPDMIIKYKENR